MRTPAFPRAAWARLAALVAPVALVLASCSSRDDAPQTTLRPEGPIARQLDRLWDPVFLIAVVVFVLVEAAVVYVAIRFRVRPGHEGDEAPKQVHGNTRLEIAWTAIPAILLAFIGVYTVATVIDINRVEASPEVINVEVVGHQWWWEYRYDDPEIVTANELVIPTGRRVELTLKSNDVIHSFWPPALAGKVDVIPGRVNTMAVQADKPGFYPGQCGEFCGISHSRMRLAVVALEPAEYDEWVANQTRGPSTPAGGEAAEGAELFESRGCTSCHTVEGVSEGVIGPNLTHFASRSTFAGSIFERTPQNLRLWLRDPQKQKAGNKMVLPVPLTEDEITKLIAYLQTLK